MVIRAGMVKDTAVVIDVGINVSGYGSVGDANLEWVVKARLITPASGEADLPQQSSS